MSAQLGFAVARKTSRATLLGTWLDGGRIDVYTGARPVSADTAITDQTLLCTIELLDPAGTVAGATWTGNLPADPLVLATGTPTWARAYDDADAAIADIDAGETGSGSALEFSAATLVAGGYANVTGLAITEG